MKRSIFSWPGCVWMAMAGTLSVFAQPGSVGLAIKPDSINLRIEQQEFRFTREAQRWAFDGASIRGKPLAKPLSRTDSFFVGGGEASDFEVSNDDRQVKVVRFKVGTNFVSYSADARNPLPAVQIQIDGPETAACAFRTVGASEDEHGAWVTRGWVATDLDDQEAFIDGSNPLVFGHATTGKQDVSYVFRAEVNPHLQGNGRTEQRSQTWFKSTRFDAGRNQFHGSWQIRMGAKEPKRFAVVFDGDLGERIGCVCEKYYAAAVDSLADPGSISSAFNRTRCVEVMPLRLASPDAFIPGWGWMMDEFPKASYPFAHDSVWQQGAFLVLEGCATRRDWERNFGKYILDQTPLEGKPGTSYFVRKPGGLVRWGYFSTYQNPFPPLDGGTWWTADILYRTARILGDQKLRQAAVDMVRHDLDVKLDLLRMKYPPCWDPVKDQVGQDHRDDWFATPGLAYCAYVASTIAYPETHDHSYLAKSDRICNWFADYLYPERKLNFIQGDNMYATFSHYLTLAFLSQYDRTSDPRFLAMARDMAWVHIMTLATTSTRDTGGRPLAGVTCVGVRDCVDYDCSPNLCQEKDLTFVHIIGPLLDHFGGTAYAKYLALQQLALDKDSWSSAWAAELKDTNLRTMYDTYARGMANLIQAMETCDDPHIVAVEKLVSECNPEVAHRRNLVVANGTQQDRNTRLKFQFLPTGTYHLWVSGQNRGIVNDIELGDGIPLSLRANSMIDAKIQPVKLATPPQSPREFDNSSTYLSDLEPLGAQRGIGFPQPTYSKDTSLGGGRIQLGGRVFEKGLGCGANTVIVFRLDGQYERFKSVVGIAHEMAEATEPKPSAYLTVHVDGVPKFESGPISAGTAPQEVDVDVRNARVLMLRVSCNWDDRGDGRHDHADWADARLVGKLKK